MLRIRTFTSDERREVAERLKVYSHDFDFGDSDPFWYVAKAAFGDVDAHTYYSVFARLADLIDPVCTVEWKHVVVEEHYRHTLILPTCSVCGHPFDKRIGPPNFCPICGARLVERGDA